MLTLITPEKIKPSFRADFTTFLNSSYLRLPIASPIKISAEKAIPSRAKAEKIVICNKMWLAAKTSEPKSIPKIRYDKKTD